MVDNYSLKFNLMEHLDETYFISKIVYEAEEEIVPKVIGAVIELLTEGYLTGASYENIKEVFELLIINKDAEIDWDDSEEINDLLEKYI